MLCLDDKIMQHTST